MKTYNPVAHLKMMVANEGNIFLDRIEAKSDSWQNSVFLVVPMRLGLNRIEPEYLHSIKEIFGTLRT